MNGIVIKKLSPKLLDDYLHFFDNDAFADNPEWSACYCRCHHVDHTKCDFDSISAEENRAETIKLIKSGIIKGYLAYEKNKPIGWLNANDRNNFTAVPYNNLNRSENIGSVMCFVIAKGYRRQGIAHMLLDCAIKGFKQLGLDYAEAYPVKNADSEDKNYHGPLSLYLSSGFKEHDEEIRGDVEVIIVRKNL